METDHTWVSDDCDFTVRVTCNNVKNYIHFIVEDSTDRDTEPETITYYMTPNEFEKLAEFFVTAKESILGIYEFDDEEE